MKKFKFSRGLLGLILALLLAAAVACQQANTPPTIHGITVNEVEVVEVEVTRVVTETVEVEVTRVVTEAVEVPCPEIGTVLVLAEDTEAWAAPIGSAGGTPWQDHVSPRRDGNIPAGSEVEITECGFTGLEYQQGWWVVKLGQEQLWMQATTKTTQAEQPAAPTATPSPTPPTETATPAPTETPATLACFFDTEAGSVIYANTGVGIFEEPDAGSAKAEVGLKYQDPVTILECSNTDNWLLVRTAEGLEGWVSKDLMSVNLPPNDPSEGSTSTPTSGENALAVAFWNADKGVSLGSGGKWEAHLIVRVPAGYPIGNVKFSGFEGEHVLLTFLETEDGFDKYLFVIDDIGCDAPLTAEISAPMLVFQHYFQQGVNDPNTFVQVPNPCQ